MLVKLQNLAELDQFLVRVVAAKVFIKRVEAMKQFYFIVNIGFDQFYLEHQFFQKLNIWLMVVNT